MNRLLRADGAGSEEKRFEMAKKSGLLAEINRQQKAAERRRKAAERERAASIRKFEQAQRAEEKAIAAAAKASAAEQKRLEKLAHEAHVERRLAEVEALNDRLAGELEVLGGILESTLDVDDFVDLESLKRQPDSRSVHRPDLQPRPVAPAVPPPPEPVFTPPAAPSGVGRLLGKNKHAEQLAEVERSHAVAVQSWQQAVAQHQANREQLVAEHQRAEAARASELDAAYAAHIAEVDEQNQAIDSLIANLGYGVSEAVEEYVSIVVANSIYPEEFEVSHDFVFSGETAELSIKAMVPSPEAIPTVKTYKYVKASDEIKATDLSAKARKDLYAAAIDQVALRTLHEVFEADRRGLVQTMSLQVGTNAPSPATGQIEFIPFVAVSAGRDEFMQFDLAAVLPAATLAHLGAGISKNALGFVAANTKGVKKV